MALKPPFCVTVLSYQGPRLPRGVAPSTIFPTHGHRGVTPSISPLGYVFSWRHLLLATVLLGRCLCLAMPLLGDASLRRCLSWEMPLSGDASLGRCLSWVMPLSGDASLGRCVSREMPLLGDVFLGSHEGSYHILALTFGPRPGTGRYNFDLCNNFHFARTV